MNEEIITNEEVIETTEEIVKAGSGKGLKVAVGAGLAILIGINVYKYVAKPLTAKIKAKKEQSKIIDTVEVEECLVDYDEDVDEAE